MQQEEMMRSSHNATTSGFGNGTWEGNRVVLLWVIYFCYATMAALLLQKLVLPLMPLLHAGYGLLQNDAILFHKEALALAGRIQQEGWGVWSLWPDIGGGLGNVGILSALYALFGPDPALLIPLNAALHALGALLIFLIGQRLWPGTVGTRGGLVASVLFLVFPSSLVWYGQIHKDGFSIAGTLLIVYAFIRAVSMDKDDLKVIVFYALTGIGLISVMRPYYFKLLVVPAIAVWSLLVVLAWFSRVDKRAVLNSTALVAMLLVSAISIKSDNTGLDGMAYAKLASFHWTDSAWLPDAIEKYIEVAAKTRYGLIQYNLSVNARTLIDSNIVLTSVGDMLRYAPRALQIALFAPFPVSWFDKPSLPILLGVAETAIWYIFVPGIFIMFVRRRSLELTVILVFSLSLLTMIGIIEPNIGTLFRMRYAYLLLLLLVGALGWVSVYRLWRERHLT